MVIYVYGTAAGGCLKSLRNIVPLQSTHALLGRHCQEQVRTSEGDSRVCFVFMFSGWNQGLDHLSWLKSCFPKEAVGFFPPLTKKEMMHQDRLDWLSWENDKLNPLFPVWIMLLSSAKSPEGYYDGCLWLCFFCIHSRSHWFLSCTKWLGTAQSKGTTTFWRLQYEMLPRQCEQKSIFVISIWVKKKSFNSV